MSCLLLDGFDKYGPTNQNNGTIVNNLLTAGEWTSSTGSGTDFAIVAGLSSSGFALFLGFNGSVTKTLAASYSRLIGGVRFASTLGFAAGVQFRDASTDQCGICINTAGTIAVRNGTFNSGTVLGTSSVSVAANTTHMLEWDITFGNSAAYQLWLDGVSILSGTGDTTATANNTASAFRLVAGVGGAGFTVDDLYLYDTSGGTTGPLLTGPRVDTRFPSADSAVQFSVGAGILGNSIARGPGSSGQHTDVSQIRLQAFIPGAACTLTSVSLLPYSTSGSIQLRPVVYADSSGTPSTLLGSGSIVTAMTANTVKTMPLTSSISLTAGTRYWLGFMTDIQVINGLYRQSSTANDRIGTSTFASGAPGTAPSMSTAFESAIFGAVTISGNNWAAVSTNPPQGDLSYLYDGTVGHEDLYTFPALGVPASAVIYAVAVKASVSKTDAGTKTVSVRLKSGATDSAGGGGTALAPGTTYGWLTSLFLTDPATSAAWTLSALNAATSGLKIES